MCLIKYTRIEADKSLNVGNVIEMQTYEWLNVDMFTYCRLMEG